MSLEQSGLVGSPADQASASMVDHSELHRGLGVSSIVAMVVAALGYGLWPSLSALRLGFASGILVGLGGVFAYGAANTFLACAVTTDFCGGADIVPIAALAADGYAGFASLEPHLAAAHELGGFSGPVAFGVAARAFAGLAAKNGVRLA